MDKLQRLLTTCISESYLTKAVALTTLVTYFSSEEFSTLKTRVYKLQAKLRETLDPLTETAAKPIIQPYYSFFSFDTSPLESYHIIIHTYCENSFTDKGKRKTATLRKIEEISVKIDTVCLHFLEVIDKLLAHTSNPTYLRLLFNIQTPVWYTGINSVPLIAYQILGDIEKRSDTFVYREIVNPLLHLNLPYKHTINFSKLPTIQNPVLVPLIRHLYPEFHI